MPAGDLLQHVVQGCPPVSMETVRLVFSLNPRPLQMKYPIEKAATCSSATGMERSSP